MQQREGERSVGWGRDKPGGPHIVDAEETECHDMGAPFGPRATGAAAGSDPAAVKHHGHVVGPFGRDHLRWHHRSTQVEP